LKKKSFCFRVLAKYRDGGNETKIVFASESGLPDGLVSDQISKFGYILEDNRMENVVIFSGHLEYFTTIG
jgi:hypothetical protein